MRLHHKAKQRQRKFELEPEVATKQSSSTSKTPKETGERRYEVKDYEIATLVPQKIDSGSTHIPLNSLMKQDIIPKHPFSMLLVGKSGSGKSNCLIWTLNELYKKYFERIVVIGATVKSDEMYDAIDETIDDKDKISDNLVSECRRVLEERQAEVESKGVTNCSRMLVILEDCTSERKLQASQAFTKLFVQLRHLGASVICCAHKLRAIPRVCRLNAVALLVFPLDRSDTKILIEEYCSMYLNKKEFAGLLKHCWEPTDEFVRPFLYYNRTLPQKVSFRKGFSEICEIK